MPDLTTELTNAKNWRTVHGSTRKASPRYELWFPLARALHTDPSDPWPAMEIARYLKQHPQAKRHFAGVSLQALHRALCRHLNKPT